MHLNYQVTFTKMTVCLQSLKSEREKEREREREMTQTNFLSYVYLYMYKYLDLAHENQMCILF